MTGRNHCNTPPEAKSLGAVRWFACPDCGWVTGRRCLTLIEAAKDWNLAIDVLARGQANRGEWRLLVALAGSPAVAGAVWKHRRCGQDTRTPGPAPVRCLTCELVDASGVAFEPWWVGEEVAAEIGPEGQSRLSASAEIGPAGNRPLSASGGASPEGEAQA